MKHRLSFSVCLPLLLVLQSSGLKCGRNQYSSSDNTKCCHFCAPGTEMQHRCSKDTDTICRACKEGSYNAVFSTWDCKSCTFCNPAHGLREARKCESASDRVCECRAGYEPAPTESDEKRCKPCRAGHFSKGGNSACIPWTNCTARGRNTVLPGTKENDAVCDNSPAMPRATECPTKHASKGETAHATPATQPASKPLPSSSTWTASSTGGQPEGAKKSGYLLYILVAATFLLVLAGVVLLKAFRKTKTYKEPGRFVEQMQKDGKNSFRIPIQEEQIDAKSSLVQN